MTNQTQPKHICGSCGTATDKLKTVTKGSFLLELILWLCLIIPGLIYSLWRCTSRHKACPTCGSTDIIPTTSPRGKTIYRDTLYK